jgi:hypothetical protein
MSTRNWRKVYSTIPAILYGICVAFGICSFKFDRKTGKMKRSRFLTIYSSAVSTALLVLVPVGQISAVLTVLEITNTVGLVMILSTGIAVATTRYFVQLTIFWRVIFKRDELFQLVNAMIRLSGILRRNIRGFEVDKRMVFLLLLKIIANVMEFSINIILFTLAYKVTKKIGFLLFQFYLVAIFILKTVECVKSCAFFHASSLIGFLNHRLKACTTRNQDGLKHEEIFNEFRKINETMKLNLRVFAAQTFAYQLSLFLQITCDVSQCYFYWYTKWSTSNF